MPQDGVNLPFTPGKVKAKIIRQDAVIFMEIAFLGPF
jgi:hypothetical protein